jgi:hypothetical protein
MGFKFYSKNDDWWPSIIMLLSCNLYVSVVHVYRSSTEHFWAGMSSYVGFYMILVYDVRIMMWPGHISSDLFRSISRSDLQVEQSNFWSVWLSSVSHDPHGSMILLFKRSYYFDDRDLRDHVNLVGRGFQPRTNQYDFCIGPGFDTQARLPVSGQCDLWPMSGCDVKFDKKHENTSLRRNALMILRTNFWCLNSGGA